MQCTDKTDKTKLGLYLLLHLIRTCTHYKNTKRQNGRYFLNGKKVARIQRSDIWGGGGCIDV